VQPQPVADSKFMSEDDHRRERRMMKRTSDRPRLMAFSHLPKLLLTRYIVPRRPMYAPDKGWQVKQRLVPETSPVSAKDDNSPAMSSPLLINRESNEGSSSAERVSGFCYPSSIFSLSLRAPFSFIPFCRLNRILTLMKSGRSISKYLRET
jgi:hypothetical protein